MLDEYQPETDEGPSLVPPRRLPPTAVGTATPPPPRRSEPEDHGDRLTLSMRIARGLLGTLFVTGGVAMLTLPGVGPVFGAGIALTGAEVCYRAIRNEGVVTTMRRAWRGQSHAPPRHQVRRAPKRKNQSE